MRTHLYRAVFAVLLVLLAIPSAAQQPPTAAPAPPAAPAAPAPAAAPPPPPRPAQPAPTAPVLAPLTTHQPVPAPLQVIPPAPRPAAPPGAANFNYRVEVQVTDRLDAKVIAQETFTALVSLSNTTKVSRTTPAARAALEVMVLPVTPGPVSQYPAPTDPVKVKLVAQFNLAKGSANEKDPGVDIGQEVVTVVAPGKPATMVDLSSGPGRRFVVQVTLTRVPVE